MRQWTKSQWRSQGLLGRASRPPASHHDPENQNEEENEEKLKKTRENRPTGKWGKIEEIFLTCPPRSEMLAIALPKSRMIALIAGQGFAAVQWRENIKEK